MNYEIKTLALADITVDAELQPRTNRNKTLSKHFIHLLEDYRVEFPPLIIFQTEDTYFLADGFHRFFAYQKTLTDEVQCKVYQGTKRDALLYSVGANGQHGLNMTNADKRRAVTKLLEDPEWSTWSNNKIAQTCHVDQTFVGKMRKSLGLNHSDIPQERTYTNKHGGTSVMNTGNIGKHSKAASLDQSLMADTNTHTDFGDLSTGDLKKRLAVALTEIEMKDSIIAELENEIEQLKSQLGVGV
jgi:hypothetical protein